MCVDNWYTSLDLAEKLVQQETHFLGTVRKNRKNLTKDVMIANLKPDELSAKENENGITIIKCRDKPIIYLH